MKGFFVSGEQKGLDELALLLYRLKTNHHPDNKMVQRINCFVYYWCSSAIGVSSGKNCEGRPRVDIGLWRRIIACFAEFIGSTYSKLCTSHDIIDIYLQKSIPQISQKMFHVGLQHLLSRIFLGGCCVESTMSNMSRRSRTVIIPSPGPQNQRRKRFNMFCYSKFWLLPSTSTNTGHL